MRTSTPAQQDEVVIALPDSGDGPLDLWSSLDDGPSAFPREDDGAIGWAPAAFRVWMAAPAALFAMLLLVGAALLGTP